MEGLKLPLYSSTPGALGPLPFTLTRVGDQSGRCCLALFSSHARSISIAFAWWWCSWCLGCSGRKDVDWRRSWARIFVGFFEGSWCGRWTVGWSRLQSSSSILSRTVRLKVRSSNTALAWSRCCTGMISTRCSVFWRRFWPCWGNSWSRCLLHHRALQCYRGRWILRLSEDLLRSLWLARGLKHLASSLLSSSGWSSGLLVVQTCWDGWFSLACADGFARVMLGRRRNPDLQGLTRGTIWCPILGLMLFAASPSQSPGLGVTPTWGILV